MIYEKRNIDGIVVYHRGGDGDPIVLLPGVMADAESWIPVADAIDAPNPLLIVNRRGRAPSREMGADYAVECEIADISSVVRSQPGSVHLAGWSYGGLIALEGAVTGLDLASVIAYDPISRPFAPETITPVRDALAHQDFDRVVEIVNRDVSGFSQDYVDALRMTPAWPQLCRLAASLGDELAAIEQFEPHYESYAQLEIPVTLIVGEHSLRQAPYGSAFERFARAIPKALITQLVDQGHLAHVSAPTLLGRMIALAVSEADPHAR
ncbi:alpha/beta fold hydrolase [Novosphingobium terrae]|uniref:alpha/beta fold hydrolase n=1 Tax=Novosphingobium terrae TaxID=2726189 RepID=UPI00197D579B|nr:alpha/beta hydrolase [Novosphingobium terrae]